MKKSWDSIDLEGGGIQSANRHIHHNMKRHSRAYLTWLAFPLGAHRIYLDHPQGAVIFSTLSAVTLIFWLTMESTVTLAPLTLLIIMALYDIYWIDKRIVALNKALRLETYLGMGANPPKGYRGRYGETDQEQYLESYKKEKEQEQAGIQPVSQQEYKKGDRAPSFAEQESLLRELARSRNRQDDKS